MTAVAQDVEPREGQAMTAQDVTIVTTQAQLDDALARHGQHPEHTIEVRSDFRDELRVEGLYEALLRAKGKSRLRIDGTLNVEATDQSDIHAQGRVTVFAEGQSTVTAWGRCTVYASGQSETHAYGTVHVVSNDEPVVYANGMSTTEVYGPGTVFATDQAVVHVYDHEPTVQAFAHSTVHLYDRAGAAFTASVAVHRHSSTGTVMTLVNVSPVSQEVVLPLTDPDPVPVGLEEGETTFEVPMGFGKAEAAVQAAGRIASRTGSEGTHHRVDPA